MQVAKIVSKKSRKLKLTNAIGEMEKSANGWFYGQILSDFQEINYSIPI